MNEQEVKELWQLIDDYGSARVDLSWAGGGHIEEVDECDRELKQAELAIDAFIHKMKEK